MIAWLDGKLIEGAVALHITGPAFRCGLGVFETILHHGHVLPRFERHLERLKASLETFAIAHELPGDTQLRRIVLDLALANGLAGNTARVNLFCFLDDPDKAASLCVTVTPYTLETDAARSLAVYPQVHLSHLCAHKTMANLHQRLAWEYAKRAGADDAVLIDSGGAVLEASVAALLFSDGHGFFTSLTPYKLPSLTLEAARRRLPVEEVEITVAGLPEFKHAYWLNSLGGIQPVIRIDTVPYEPDWETCRPLLRELLGLEEERG